LAGNSNSEAAGDKTENSQGGNDYWVVKLFACPSPSVLGPYLGNDTSFCNSSQILLDAGAGFTSYLWQDGSTNRTYLADTAGTYWVQVTTTTGLIAMDTLMILDVLNNPPAIDNGGITSLCPGNIAVLDAGAGYYNYTWQDGWQEQTYTVTYPGNYVVTVKDPCGNSASDSVFIADDAQDLFDLGNDTILCNQNVHLQAGNGFTYYVWQDGSSGSSYTASSPGTYWVIVTNSSGCQDIDSITVKECINISGGIFSELGSPITTVNVSLTGEMISNKFTGNDGLYDFNVASHGTYTITPSKNNDSTTSNGITTLDILLMRNHILHSQLLSTGYKVIAADVNVNNTVSTTDIVLTRAVILRTTSAFPNNRLWSFVRSDYVFPDPLNPFQYDNNQTYNNISNDQTAQNFISLKLGDVNNSWDPSTPKMVPVGEVQFNIGNYFVNPGDEIIIPVRVKDFTNIAGYQFTISWNSEVLSFNEVSNNALLGYYGFQATKEGFLTTSWNETNGAAVTLENNTVVFELKYNIAGGYNSDSDIKIGSEITPGESYNGKLELLNIMSSSGSVIVNGLNPTLQINPNPFSNIATIVFTLPEAETVSIVIYDLLGRVISQAEAEYEAGRHNIEWSADKLNKGIYFVRILAGEYSASEKVSLLR